MSDSVTAPTLRQRVETFFFAEESTRFAVRWRQALALWTVLFFLPRLPYLDELYTDLAVHTPHPLLERFFGVPLLPLWAVWAVMGSCLACLGLFMAGIQVRRMHVLILAHLCYLYGFDISILRGYGELAFYQWLILWFLPYDGVKSGQGEPSMAPRWGTQLARIQFTLVYVLTVPAKLLGGAGWLDGKTLYYTLKGQDYGQFLLSAWIPVNQQATMVMGWMVLMGELVVGVGLWFERTRKLAIVTCLLLHVGMALMLRVSFLFPLLMWAHLVLFMGWRSAKT